MRALVIAVTLLLSITRAQAQVIGGTAARGDRAIVGLAGRLGTVYCSGTLVSPRLVLTAAHCVAQPPSLVFFGTDPDVDGAFVPVAEVVVHPGLPGSPPPDLALVALARPVPVPPIPLAPTTSAADLGRPVRVVGFGYTAPRNGGELGRKRSASTTITAVADGVFYHGPIACHGDSGGPVLVATAAGERLAGVTSFGDPDCVEFSAAVDVGSAAGWIDEVEAGADPSTCGLDGRCRAACATPDLDCGAAPAPDPAAGCSAARSPAGMLVVVLASLLSWRRRGRRRVGRATLAALAIAATATACAEAPAPGVELRTLCTARPIGDPTAAVESEPVMMVGADVVRLGDHRAASDRLRLSVEARNLDGCAVSLDVRVEAVDDGRVLARDGAVLELDLVDGWGRPRSLGDDSFIDLVLDPTIPARVVVSVEDDRGHGTSVVR